MAKHKILCLIFLFFTIHTMYGCKTQTVRTPIRDRHIGTITRPKIIVPDAVTKELNKFKIRPWKYIVIHHSANDFGNASSIGKYHKEVRGWENGLGYHFVIGNGKGTYDGQLEVGDRWNKQIDGAHAGKAEYNKYGVGICLVGNFENTRPTNPQISTLLYLINYLQDRCNISNNNVIMHRTFRKTACPGKNFPYKKVLSRLW